MAEFPISIWLTAIVVFGFFVFLAYPHSLATLIMERRWTTTSKNSLPFNVSILTIILITIIVFIFIEYYHDIRIKEEGIKLSDEIVNFFSERTKQRPSFRTNKELWDKSIEEMDSFHAHTQSEYLSKFVTRVGIICRKLKERDLIERGDIA